MLATLPPASSELTHLPSPQIPSLSMGKCRLKHPEGVEQSCRFQGDASKAESKERGEAI
jgi:hypothetical protein